MPQRRSRTRFQEKIAAWPISQRIEKAKSITIRLTHLVTNTIELSCVCHHFLYSNEFTSQIPPSYAGHAFRSTQDALFRQLVIATVSMWDAAEANAVSIPTVIDLIDDPATIHELQRAHFEAHAHTGYRHLNPSNDPEIQAAIDECHRQRQAEFAASQAEKADQELRVCIEAVREAINLKLHESIKNARDHFSHSLEQTRGELSAPVPPMKYGEERDLLEKSARIIENLYVWVNGVSLDLHDDVWTRSRRNADELWRNCRFEIGRRPQEIKCNS